MSLLGDYLLVARFSKRMSLRKAEELSGVSNAYISQLESGKREDPHPKILKKLAAAYNVRVSTLMEVAGYLNEDFDINDENADVERKFNLARTDSAFVHGEEVPDSLDLATKKFIVEIYNRYISIITGRK